MTCYVLWYTHANSGVEEGSQFGGLINQQERILWRTLKIREGFSPLALPFCHVCVTAGITINALKLDISNFSIVTTTYSNIVCTKNLRVLYCTDGNLERMFVILFTNPRMMKISDSSHQNLYPQRLWHTIILLCSMLCITMY